MIVRLLTQALLGAAAAAGTTFVLVAQAGSTHFMLDQLNSGLSLVVPALTLIAALALRVMAIGGRLTAVIAALGIAVGGWQLGSAAIAPTDRDVPAGAPAIKLLTLSTFHSNPTPEAIRQVVETEAPDIAVLQETNRNTRLVVESLLPDFHRVKSCNFRFCSLTILSRWPLVRAQLDYGRDREFPDLLAADVDAPFGRFRVIDVHMPRPNDIRIRTFITDLANAARGQAGPLMVAGDFNTATGSFGLNRFAARSGLRRLEGFVPTFPANLAIPAFVGIDHVFTDANWVSQGCYRTSAGGSDHYGIACTLRLVER